MLLGFPQILEDELLYSALARFRIYMGITCNKSYLKMLYNDQNIQPCYDLPSNIDYLKKNINRPNIFDSSSVIYSNTLFPLHAPFIPNERKKKIYRQLLNNTGNYAHARVGIASKLNTPIEVFNFCPKCHEEMRTQFGEYYWKRSHQINGVLV